MLKIFSNFILFTLIGTAFSLNLSYSLEDPKKSWSDNTEEEKEGINAKLLRETQSGEELRGFANRIPFSEKDNKLLKELGVTSFDHRIKNYDLGGINFENQDLSNLNLNVINFQELRLRGTNLSKASLIRADLISADLTY
jgi:uncharacterized protein YjbI with pentapeptide repeats